MKKIFTLCLSFFWMLSLLTACDVFAGYGESFKYVKYENSAVFAFDDFPVRKKVSVELDRTCNNEGEIYYLVNLEEGDLNVYYKYGVIDTLQPLGEFTADVEMPVIGSGGYIEGDNVTINFKSNDQISGEVIIAFTEGALKAVQANLQLHQHTYSYTSAGEVGHYTNSTCGCPSEEGTTPHFDENCDYICDVCKCDMTEFADEWLYDETHHWYVSDNEEVYCYGEHENWDADLICDICNYCLYKNCELGHSWDEGKLTQVPGGGEDLLYTCLVCGETTSERVNNGNVYSLTITGAVEYVIEDISGEYAENSLIMISTQILIDTDIEVYVNGMKAEKDKTSNHKGTELFIFSMPSEDAVVEIKVVTSKYFTVTLHDLDDYQWVNELDRNDIIKVKYESSAIGIAPGNLINIVYSTDPEDISKLYDAIILARYVETDMEYAVMDGGGYRKYEFITNDKTYSVYLSNGFVISQQNHPSAEVTDLKYYKFLGEHYTFTNPSLECNSFLVYNDTYQAYITEDDTLIGEYEGLDEFEFVPYEGPLVGWETPYYIETQFGRVYIHTKKIIYLKDGNTFTYFQIVGDKDFSFLFNN